MRSMRFMICLILTALSTMGPSMSATIEEGARASIVEVNSNTTNGYLIGSGVVVLRGRESLDILTAAHVVRGTSPKIKIWGDPYAAQILRIYPGRDLALLRARVPEQELREIRAATFGNAGPVDGALFVWGTRGNGLVRHDARLLDENFIAPIPGQHGKLLKIRCADCDHGDSGGGIFSPDGGLVAILIARIERDGDHQLIGVVGERVDARTP